jgi:hypothetical protein
MALAGSEERADCEGSASVSAIHAPFATEVACPSLIRLDAQDAVCRRAQRSFAKSWPELQMGIMQPNRVAPTQLADSARPVARALACQAAQGA